MDMKKALSEKGQDRATLNLWILGTTFAIVTYLLLDGPGLPEPASGDYHARRTSTGSLVEKGADIDYRIDSDRIINLSVNAIRYKGYRCNSVSSIKLYKYPERIVVECNGGKDRYKIQRDSAGRLRQVTRH